MADASPTVSDDRPSAPSSFDFAEDISEEERRLAALYRYDILDTSPEHAFDHIAELAAHLFNAPIALVSLVDSDRQWFKACIGMSERETGLDASFCVYAIQSEGLTIVSDTTEDPRFAYNPLVTGEPGIRFYAGAPLEISTGHRIGTLCVIDTTARSTVEPAQRRHLKRLAKLVVDELELRREIKVRKQREEELERAHAAAQEARNEAEQANAAMSRFFAGIVHDLRNPLTRMLLFTDLLERSMEEASPHLEKIRSAGHQLKSMIHSLLDLSQLRSGHISFDLSPVDVGDVVRTAWAKAQETDDAAPRTVEIDLPEPPLRAMADADALTRVLDNIIGNALKYTEPDDHIRISARPVNAQFGDSAESSEPPSRDAVCIDICDSGPGIDPDLLDTLFDPFTRGTQKAEGMGLGLAISKDLMEAMDGTIRVQSEVGEGTCFQLLIVRA